MNVFGVGPLELVVVLLVALIFVGPERLPRLAADLARMIREVRRYTGKVAAEFNDVLADLEKETETERSDWKEIGRGLDEATRTVGEELQRTQAEAQGTAAPTAAPSAPANGTSQNGAAPTPAEPVEEPR